jgi:lipid-A-disaccharide synthase
MNQSEVVLLASGTVTLEAAIVGVPMVVAYWVPRLTYFLARRLVKVPFISLVNLIAEEELVKELLQEEASPENLAQEASRFLASAEEGRLLRERLSLLRNRLGSPGVAWRVAELALGFARQRLH